MQGAVQMHLETSNKSEASLNQLGSSTVSKVNLNRVGGLPVSQLVPVFGKGDHALRVRIILGAVPISVCLSSVWLTSANLGWSEVLRNPTGMAGRDGHGNWSEYHSSDFWCLCWPLSWWVCEANLGFVRMVPDEVSKLVESQKSWFLCNN